MTSGHAATPSTRARKLLAGASLLLVVSAGTTPAGASPLMVAPAAARRIELDAGTTVVPRSLSLGANGWLNIVSSVPWDGGANPDATWLLSVDPGVAEPEDDGRSYYDPVFAAAGAISTPDGGVLAWGHEADYPGLWSMRRYREDGFLVWHRRSQDPALQIVDVELASAQPGEPVFFVLGAKAGQVLLWRMTLTTGEPDRGFRPAVVAVPKSIADVRFQPDKLAVVGAGKDARLVISATFHRATWTDKRRSASDDQAEKTRLETRQEGWRATLAAMEQAGADQHRTLDGTIYTRAQVAAEVSALQEQIDALAQAVRHVSSIERALLLVVTDLDGKHPQQVPLRFGADALDVFSGSSNPNADRSPPILTAEACQEQMTGSFFEHLEFGLVEGQLAVLGAYHGSVGAPWLWTARVPLAADTVTRDIVPRSIRLPSGLTVDAIVAAGGHGFFVVGHAGEGGPQIVGLSADYALAAPIAVDNVAGVATFHGAAVTPHALHLLYSSTPGASPGGRATHLITIGRADGLDLAQGN